MKPFSVSFTFSLALSHSAFFVGFYNSTVPFSTLFFSLAKSVYVCDGVPILFAKETNTSTKNYDSMMEKNDISFTCIVPMSLQNVSLVASNRLGILISLFSYFGFFSMSLVDKLMYKSIEIVSMHSAFACSFVHTFKFITGLPILRKTEKEK